MQLRQWSTMEPIAWRGSRPHGTRVALVKRTACQGAQAHRPGGRRATGRYARELAYASSAWVFTHGETHISMLVEHAWRMSERRARDGAAKGGAQGHV